MALSDSDRAILLARYKENGDQARQHETLRERSTMTVAQTTGVLLGLMVLKDGSLNSGIIVWLISSFIILLGAWGIFSSIIFDSRARRHRQRIVEIRNKLEEKNEVIQASFNPWEIRLNWVWIIFHLFIMAIGVSMIILRASS